MKREKRKYIFLLIAAFILPFSIAFLVTSVDELFFYGKAEAEIVSVDTKLREGGTSGDTYYYTQSSIKCIYTVDGREFSKHFTIKADYSGQEGTTITVLYDKEKPLECVMESKSVTAFLYSIIFTAGSVWYIMADIMGWVRARKEENISISLDTLSESDIQQYAAQLKKPKRINIILTIISILLIPLFIFEIPLIVFTIARNVDHMMCNRIFQKNTEE